jgi:hypothetical protein
MTVVLALLLLGASGAYAQTLSMVLTSSGNGEFVYAVHQPGSIAEVDFITGETITLSGLSGVTNATVSNLFLNVNFVPTFTSTSVTLTLSFPTISLGSVNGTPGGGGTDLGYLAVFSSAPTGLVNYDIEAQLGSFDIAQQQHFTGLVAGPVAEPYKALVQPPINADGSSVFKANRGVVPVKFTLTQNDVPTCTLPAATISVTRTTGGTVVAESIYITPADIGSNFRIDPTACQYIYNLAASSLGAATYRVDISINGIVVGHAAFAVQ